ncbi:DUF1851 domain-containing protein [Brevundimonas sp. BR2-1]|uniref:T6SS immunity protein Tdi1 domain-containing protein n=1 Tax=Brevundimonas sp. BR2-1 TaxID=3031123 RepID=UPI00309A9DEE
MRPWRFPTSFPMLPTWHLSGWGPILRPGRKFSGPTSSGTPSWRTLENDEEGWQLRRLADACGAAGKVLAVDQCYAFTTLPVFGGSYSEENVRVAPWREWFSFTADIYRQTGHLPDGAAISLRVTD